jgi:hypothetical protein
MIVADQLDVYEDPGHGPDHGPGHGTQSTAAKHKTNSERNKLFLTSRNYGSLEKVF